jgi:hypothetical protein
LGRPASALPGKRGGLKFLVLEDVDKFFAYTPGKVGNSWDAFVKGKY